MELVLPESVGMCSKRLSLIRPVLQTQCADSHIAGASTLISRRGQPVYSDQFGYADRDTKTPMQLDTLFRIYSMTKPVIATAFMTLYEQGLVGMLDPVAEYIPEFSNLKVLKRLGHGKTALVKSDRPITIQQLLTHTSGLGLDLYEEYPEVARAYRSRQILHDSGISLEQLVQRICTLPLAFQPGTRWLYSVGVDVIARMIEIISGKTLSDFLNQTIFQPLGMRDTGFFVPEEKRSRMAAVYGDIDYCGKNVSFADITASQDHLTGNALDVSETCPIDNISFQRGGYGLVSSIQDFWKFSQMLLNQGRFDEVIVLSPSTVNFMHRNHLSHQLLQESAVHFDDVVLAGYGFGLGSRVLLSVPESGLVGSVGEFGWSGVAKTYYWIDPKEQLIGIFMAQSMLNFSPIESSFQTLTYQSIV